MALRYEVEGSSYWDLVCLAQLSRWEKADEQGVAWGRGEHGRGGVLGACTSWTTGGKGTFFLQAVRQGGGWWWAAAQPSGQLMGRVGGVFFCGG